MSPPPRKTVLIYLTWSAPNLWHGIRAYARDADWHLVFPQRPTSPPQASSDFDGAILLVGEDEIFDPSQLFPGTKIVDIRGTLGLKSDATVTIDHEEVGAMAANYLHDLGCRSFLCLTLKKTWRGVSDRTLSFTKHLREKNQEAQLLYYDRWVPNLVCRTEEFKAEVEAAVHSLPRPCGVFCADDYVADMFLQGVLELGYQVPEDIAVLGANNDLGFCEMSLVPLSSIDVNLSELGYEAARQLDRLMAGDTTVPKSIQIRPQQIVHRRSTEKDGCTDRIVNAILAYIREHFAEKISAEHIIRTIHASRTNAFLKFRKITGHTIGEEIERVRIDHAKSLLQSTDFKIEAIARLSGYLNASAFCRAFKKYVGKTPSKVRAENSVGQTNRRY